MRSKGSSCCTVSPRLVCSTCLLDGFACTHGASLDANDNDRAIRTLTFPISAGPSSSLHPQPCSSPPSCSSASSRSLLSRSPSRRGELRDFGGERGYGCVSLALANEAPLSRGLTDTGSSDSTTIVVFRDFHSGDWDPSIKMKQSFALSTTLNYLDDLSRGAPFPYRSHCDPSRSLTASSRRTARKQQPKSCLTFRLGRLQTQNRRRVSPRESVLDGRQAKRAECDVDLRGDARDGVVNSEYSSRPSPFAPSSPRLL